MGIFPQGHRYPAVDPKTTKTKNGAALIATRAEANVIPAYIAYNYLVNRIQSITLDMEKAALEIQSFLETRRAEEQK